MYYSFGNIFLFSEKIKTAEEMKIALYKLEGIDPYSHLSYKEAKNLFDSQPFEEFMGINIDYLMNLNKMQLDELILKVSRMYRIHVPDYGIYPVNESMINENSLIINFDENPKLILNEKERLDNSWD